MNCWQQGWIAFWAGAAFGCVILWVILWATSK